MGLGKQYSLFCTEGTLESVLYSIFRLLSKKEKKFTKNLSAKGENVKILGKETIF